MAEVFRTIEVRLGEIGKIIGLSDKEIKYLLKSHEIHRAELKVGGKTLSAWRVVHNRVLGPGKGGIRFHPNVNEDEVRSLAFWMMVKNSLAGLPYGGGKGGVAFDPKSVSKEELQQISRAYADAFYKHLGVDKDVPAPDVYTDGQIMSWILDQYEKKVGYHEPGMITGKPIDLGGLKLRADATARGGEIVLREMMAELKGKGKLRVAIQGFGNAGSHLARMLSGEGHKVVAVSDSRGGIYQAAGLNIAKIIALKEAGKSVVDYSLGEKISNEELLEIETDVLVLAALENQITEHNAARIKAKYLLELANGPVTEQADKILFQKGITVVPDILANSGGVVVSYFEWAQNRTGNILEEDYLATRLQTLMKNNWRRVRTKQQELGNIDLRTAAYALAIERILKAARLRGEV